MIQILNAPDHVVAFRASGDITIEDYQTMLIPALDNLVKYMGEINFFLVLETDVMNYAAGAWVEDAMIGLKNFGKWNRAAIVSDSEHVINFTNSFSYIAPGEFKGFKKGDFQTALQWVEGHH